MFAIMEAPFVAFATKDGALPSLQPTTRLALSQMKSTDSATMLCHHILITQSAISLHHFFGNAFSAISLDEHMCFTEKLTEMR